MEVLRDVLPLHFTQSARTGTVLVGLVLILLAEGLRKRRQRALQLSVIGLLISSVLNILKGLDVEEAAVALVLALTLLAVRGAFSIASGPPVSRNTVQPVAVGVLLYYGYALAGFLILRSSVFPSPALLDIIKEPVHLVLGDSRLHYLGADGRWFERTLTIVGGLAIICMLLAALQPMLPSLRPSRDEVRRVRAILRRHGVDSLSYFALQHGRSYFFDQSGEAFLSYRVWGTVALVGGDPVGPSHLFPELVASFLEYADAYGLDPCFLGVPAKSLQLYQSFGLGTLKIGEEAVIDLPSFSEPALKRKVRRAVRHVHEQGIKLVHCRCREVPGALLDQAAALSNDWVKANGGKERGFSMTLGRLPGSEDEDCEYVFAMEGNQVLGYLCFVPVYGDGNWSLDAMRRRPDTPNGLMEFLIVQAAGMYRDRGV